MHLSYARSIVEEKMIRTDYGSYFARYTVEKAGEEEEYFTNIIHAEFFTIKGDDEPK